MTEITFHVGVEDKISYVCRLARKAFASGARVVVLATDEMCAALDQALWTVAPSEFLAHCRAGADAPAWAFSPVVLVSPSASATFPHHDVMVNLIDAVPAGFGSFERFNEIIGFDGAEIQAGRQRYKGYKSRGYALRIFDNSAPPAAPATS